MRTTWLWVIILALRLVYALSATQIDPLLRRDPLYGDAEVYDKMAWTLASEGRLEFYEKGLRISPGYIWLMAGVYRLVGHEPQAVRMLNALLGMLVIGGAWRCAQSLYGDRVARWVLGFTALHPQLIHLSGWLYTENLAIPLVVWSVYALWHARTTRQFALGGVLLGALCLTRANFLPFLLFACGWVWWIGKKNGRMGEKNGWKDGGVEGWKGGRMEDEKKPEARIPEAPSPTPNTQHPTPNTQRFFILLLAACLVIAPYVIYLYARFDRFVPIGVGGYLLFWANNPQADGGFSKVPKSLYVGGQWVEVKAYTQAANPVDEDRRYMQLAWQWIREHPADFAWLTALKTRLTLSPLGLQNPKHRRLVPSLLIADILFWFYLLIAHVGVLYGCRRRMRELSLVFGLWVLTWSLIWVYAGGVRMLLPATPFIVIFFVRGLQLLGARRR